VANNTNLIACCLAAAVRQAALAFIIYDFDEVLNFIGLAIVGLGATLLGGCPLRQTVMAGEGDTDAGLAFLGMTAGAAFAHNFGLAAGPAGVPVAGQAAAFFSVIFLLGLGFAFSASQSNIPIKGGVASER